MVDEEESAKKAVDLFVVGEESESREEDKAGYCRFDLQNSDWLTGGPEKLYCRAKVASRSPLPKH